MKKLKSNFLIPAIAVFCVFLNACNNSEEKPVHDHSKMEMKPEDKPIVAGESIYQLEGKWVNQDGNSFNLNELKGKNPIMAMVFTHCEYACPRIVGDIKNIKEKIPADKKEDFVYVLVSFDTERDHPDRLREFAKEMQLDENWILLHGNENDVRGLSTLLNVSYKKQEDGNFAHSNQITLLNKEGEIIEQIEGLGTDPQPILQKIETI